MNKEESYKLLTDIKELWADWTPTEAEVGVCARSLSKIRVSYDTGKKTVDDFYINQTMTRKRPQLPKIIQMLKMKQQRREESNQPTLLYTIVKKSLYDRFGDRAGQKFSVRGDIEPPSFMECEERASRDKRRMDNLYGEEHIIVYADE